MMWSTSYLAFRVMVFLARTYAFLDGLFLRLGLAVCLSGGLLLGVVFGWFLAPFEVLFSMFLFFGLLEMADHAVRKPEDFRFLATITHNKNADKRLMRFILIGAALMVGYIVAGLTVSYWLPNGGL